jgi:crotonobetainyl-CoA:carnitine CoA-transferase CaiB-like acyl-CoA transferase
VSSDRSMLEGVRVVDMTTAIFGPYCTHMLADLGADVVKIEPRGGDGGRSIGAPKKTRGMGAMHMNVNRGKRSVVWDMKTEQGLAKTRKLIASADVFIHNIRPDAIDRLRLDYETVKAFAPGIVYVHCVGFDTDGPDAGLPAYDDIIQGSSGLTSLLPRADGRPEPRYLPTAVADKVAGLHAAQATLAALFHKARTGEGQRVEVPMFEAVTSFALIEHIGAGVFPDVPRKMGYARQISRHRQPAATADGYICIAPYNDERWQRFFEMIGRPNVFDDERLNTEWLRQKNRELLYEIANEAMPQKTTAEWLALLRAADIPARQANTLEDLPEDPQLQAVNFFRVRSHPTEGDYYELRPPVKYGARPDPEFGLAPLLGEHTLEIERELGFSGDAPVREEQA